MLTEFNYNLISTHVRGCFPSSLLLLDGYDFVLLRVEKMSRGVMVEAICLIRFSRSCLVLSSTGTILFKKVQISCAHGCSCSYAHGENDLHFLPLGEHLIRTINQVNEDSFSISPNKSSSYSSINQGKDACQKWLCLHTMH